MKDSEKRSTPQRAPGFGVAFLTAGVAIAIGAFLQRLLDSAVADGSFVGFAVACTATAILVAGLFIWRYRDAMRLLRSLRFAGALLTVLALTTMLGTFVLQDQPPEFYAGHYGPGMARFIAALHLDGLFHSFWYGALLLLLCASLVAVVAGRWPWNWRRIGFVSAHIGTVVVCTGGLLSSLFADKGRIDLVVGQQTDRFVRRDPGLFRPPVGQLGFALRLDAFEVESYEKAYNLRIFGRNETAMARLAEAQRQFAAGNMQGDEFMRIRSEAFPFVASLQAPRVPWEDVQKQRAAGQEAVALPAAGAMARLGDGWRVEVVQSGVRAPAAAPAAPVQTAKPAAAGEKPDIVYRFTAPARHTLSIDKGPEVAVRPNDRVTLPDGRRIQVGSFLPHFNFDLQQRKAINLSDRPENPALQIQLLPEHDNTPLFAGWLFANYPGFAMGGANDEAHGGAHGAEAATARGPQAFARVRVLKDGAEVMAPRDVLAGGDAVPIADGRYRLILQEEEDRIRQFFSTLSVIEDGKPVVDKERVWVNNPLWYGGFALYQANYDPRNPRYSGIEVVSDPGLPVVYAGLALLVFGVLHVFYLRNLGRGRRPAGAVGPTPDAVAARRPSAGEEQA